MKHGERRTGLVCEVWWSCSAARVAGDSHSFYSKDCNFLVFVNLLSQTHHGTAIFTYTLTAETNPIANALNVGIQP